MLTNPERVARFERRDARQRLHGLSYAQALRLFEALWAEALELGVELSGDWRADIDSSVAIARALNGLPPRA